MKISVITPSIRPEGLEIVQECLKRQTFTDFEWLVEVGLGKEHDLNKAFNKMLRRAKGELIVIYQDWIKIQDNGLELFWNEYQKTPDMFLTAPVGKQQYKDFLGNVNWDWRYYKEGSIDWLNWEIDWGAASLALLKQIGGFDETLDKYWSFDNVNVACRANLAGFKFTNVIENKSVAYDHDAHLEHPFRSKYNPEFHNSRLEQFRHGKKINYL